jgi:transketolase
MSPTPILAYAPKAEFDRIRNLPVAPAERTRLFADLARLNTLYMIERAGSGHIGSSFSSLDIVCWLHLDVMEGIDRPDGDIYFSSKGHDAPGLYAAMLALGLLPFEKIDGLRRLGGLPGHPDVGTPFIRTNTGSLGMGISKAKGFVIADRLSGRKRRIFVMTGDGELQEGQLWESLGSAANRRMGEITVIVDHNKLQSDTFVERVSALGDLEAKFAAFGWAVARCEGHDPAALSAALATLDAQADRPKVIIADTIKGAGVSFMQHTAMTADQEFYKFHSGAPGAENYAKGLAELRARIDGRLAKLGAQALTLTEQPRAPAAAPAATARLIPAYAEALLALGEKRADIVALDGDLMIDCGVLPFRDRFPDRFIECGIAEQDMVSTAGGLALAGKLPIVHSFACFLSTRPNEQIFNNGTERTKIIYAGSLAGLVPGGPGHSHQSIRDIATLSSVPGLTLVEPATTSEVAEVLEWCVSANKDSSYIRLISVPWPAPSAPQGKLIAGQGRTIRDGKDVVIFAYGPILLGEAEKAARAIEADAGVSVRVVNLPWLNNLDAEWLARSVEGARLAVALDNHARVGGQGDAIAAALAARKAAPPLLIIGIDGIAECGTPAEVLAHHGLDAASIARLAVQQLRSAS